MSLDLLRTRGRVALATVCALALAVPAAHAYDPAAEVSNYLKVHERFLHDHSDPEYQLGLRLEGVRQWLELIEINATDPERNPFTLCAEHNDGCAGDVRMYDWGEQGLGFVQEIQFVNRNGSTISGHVWAAFPRDGEATGRRPAISITNGSVQAPEELYWHAAQTLAQHGYVVLTWDPQGQGRSDAFGAGATMFRGFPAQQAPNFFEGTEEALDFLLSTPDAPYEPRAAEGSNAEAAAKQERRVASGHADAHNPLHGIVDPERIGIAGLSLGASAVSGVGTDDQRVDAIVAWDNLRAPAEGSAPRVPALGISNDYGLTPTPFTEDPDPQAKNAAFAAYRAAGVDSMQVNIRGGTHYESSYIPNPAFGATLRGIDLVGWYTTAWFDKYVKGDPTADARLLSDRWLDDPRSAEVDPAGDGNVFSSYFRSAVDVGGFECEDMRAGCGGALVPQAQDGVDGEWSFLEERRP